MFIAALFTIAKLGHRPRCPSTDEWFKNNVTCIHNTVLFNHKQDDIMSFAGKWMKLEIINAK
jgi:hypothetical protein